MRNQSSNHWITINGETKTLTDWSAQFGVNRSTAWSRIKRGVDPVLVFTKGKSNG